jgi:hypothetical protein
LDYIIGVFCTLISERRQRLNLRERKLHEIIRAGGREFRIYIEPDETGEMMPNYPDFDANPEYTDEGWPFARSISFIDCEYWKPRDSKCDFPGGCGECAWLYLESDSDIIGICKCGPRKRMEFTA